MKIKIELEGDWYEERQEILTFIKANEFNSALIEVRDIVRERCKYGENISEEEHKFIKRLQDVIYVDEDI